LSAIAFDKYSMDKLHLVAEELFNKIRGRFPSVTIGDGEGNVTNEPQQARYFDFDFVSEGQPLGKVSISLEEQQISVVYGKDLVTNEHEITKNHWYDFLKELRVFAKKRMMTFDTRDITKSNLNQRDYKFLSSNRPEEEQMRESKLYGTSKTSYQDIGDARLMFKHSAPVNTEQASGRTQRISSIYIESPEGERFKYPFRHIAGARAMARHVSEGGKPYDDFGEHVKGLSEEMYKLRKFKNHMNRNSVMAESLAEYMDTVNERIQTVKKTIERIQKPSAYQEAVENFEKPVFEEVPEDVKNNWIDELTIKQFNEELADVFPYIYRLVGESTRAKDIDLADIVGEDDDDDPCWKGYKQVGMKKQDGEEVPNCVPEDIELENGFERMLGQFSENNDSQDSEDDPTEGNAYANAVRQAKKDGKKKGDKIDGPDGEEITLEKKLPLSEFILSYYDRETGKFPKGETAVLTMIEKDYGDSFVEPAKQFIERINQTFENYAKSDNSIAMEGIEADDLARVLFDRMEKRQSLKRLFNQYSNEEIVSAIRDVAADHAGAEELGSSDISAMVDEVYRQLDGKGSDTEYDRMKELAGI